MDQRLVDLNNKSMAKMVVYLQVLHACQALGMTAPAAKQWAKIPEAQQILIWFLLKVEVTWLRCEYNLASIGLWIGLGCFWQVTTHNS
jgi:hypothetical protein